MKIRFLLLVLFLSRVEALWDELLLVLFLFKLSVFFLKDLNNAFNLLKVLVYFLQINIKLLVFWCKWLILLF